MSSLMVAMAISETDIINGKYVQLLDQDACFHNIYENITKLIADNSSRKDVVTTGSTETPEPDEFQIFTGSTPKKFALMVKESNHITVTEDTKPPSPKPVNIITKKEVIVYKKRNILDLGKNLSRSLDFYDAAILPMDCQGFFQNRSQIHRVKGNEEIEVKDFEICEECEFQVPVFYN